MAEIIRGLPFDEYLARRAVSKSMLTEFAKAPAKAHLAKEETAAMRLGSLVHCAVLEPGELEKRYAFFAGTSRRGTNSWNEAFNLAQQQGRELVKLADWDDARRMADAVWAHPTARQLLDGCEVEVSAFWVDQETGLDCKARADVANFHANKGVDLKTCIDASPKGFERAAAKLGYHLQDAHYRPGFNFDSFVFIAIEKDSLLVACYEYEPFSRMKNETLYRGLLEQYAYHLQENHWPGYPDGINPLTTPDWAYIVE